MRDMFIEIGALVQDQGEMVDNILSHVQKAGIDVEQGKDHLSKAEEYAKSARKKKFILAAILLIVILIILLVILAEFGAFSYTDPTPTTPTTTITITVTPSPVDTPVTSPVDTFSTFSTSQRSSEVTSNPAVVKSTEPPIILPENLP